MAPKGLMMSNLAKDEREWLRSAAENSTTALAILEDHKTWLKELSAGQSAHADKITRIETTQDLCKQRNDPGNKSERNAVWVACGGVAIALMSMLWQCVELFK